MKNRMEVVERLRARYTQWMDLLEEDGISIGIKFNRMEAARAWGCTVDVASDRLTELYEIGWVTKSPRYEEKVWKRKV